MRGENVSDQEGKSALERHAQTIIGAILIGLVTWTGNSVTQSRESIARMDERFISISADIADLKKRVGDGYELRLQVNDIAQSVKHCHTKIDAIEQRLNGRHG